MDFEKIWTNYQMLIIAVFTLVIAPLFWKLAGKIWSCIVWIFERLGRLAGGKLAYRGFEKQYLNWVVTENRDLRLTGIVSHDDGKKPQLEQVFVSLRFETKNEKYADIVSIIDQARKNWWRRILLPLFFKTKERNGSMNSTYGLGVTPERINAAREHRFQGWLVRFALGIKAPPATSEGLAQLRTVLRSSQRFALLGGPGAGKTTMLQFIALVYARQRAGDTKLRKRHILSDQFDSHHWRLPIFITLRSIASKLQEDNVEEAPTSLIDLLPQTLPPDLRKTCPYNYFHDQIKSGRCILLLDGLDEVVSDTEYHKLTRALKSIVSVYPDNKFVLTSRPAGWRGGIGSEFEVLQVSDLSTEEIDTFIDAWYLAVEKNAVVGALKRESKPEQRARRRKVATQTADLKETLSRNVSIRRLAKNPLLLSIIALVHRSLATLPRERAKLYSECTKILLEQWDVSRGIRVDDTNLSLSQKEAIMRRIAYALHTGEIGDKSGGREASREQIESLVAQLLVPMGQPSDNAGKLLKRLIERSGLIAEVSRDKLFFAHLTFQEYFTAQALAAGQIPIEEIISNDEKLLSDWWREVILLYSGLITDAGDFIESIYQPARDNFFKQRLQLASMCLAEAIEVRNASLRQSIGRELISVHSNGKVNADSDTLTIEVIRYLVEWSRDQTWYEHAGIASAVKKIRTGDTLDNVFKEFTIALVSKEPAVCLAAIGVFGLLGEKASKAPLLHQLTACLSSDSESVRLMAVTTFARLSTGNQQASIADSLISLLEDKSFIVAYTSARVLIGLSMNERFDDKMVDRLWLSFDHWSKKTKTNPPDDMALWEYDLEYINPQIWMPEYLDQIEMSGSLDRFISRSRYFPFLEYRTIEERTMIIYPVMSPSRWSPLYSHYDDENPFVFRERTTQYSHLSELLTTQERETDRWLRDKAVNANPAGWVLANLARMPEHRAIIDKFLLMLDKNERETRLQVTWLLAEVAEKTASSEIANKLAELLTQENPLMRETAARLLATLGEKATTELVVAELSRHLMDSDPNVRAAATVGLGRCVGWKQAQERVSNITPLLMDKHIKVRQAVAYSLGLIGKELGIDQISNILRPLLRSKKTVIRGAAADVVAQLVYRL